jgi:holin-like protein
MLGMAILLGFNALGLGIKELLHLPLPANVIGLILFTASLFTGIVRLEWVESSAQFLTKHMMLFFIPFLVGTVSFFTYFGTHLFAIVISMFLSTFLVLIATGWVTSKLLREEENGEKQHGI